LRSLLTDLRYAIRIYRSSPLSTAAALAALALGIGANTAVFSFADALLTRPLPVHEPDQVVTLFHAGTRSGSYSSFSYPDYVELRDQNEALSGLAAWGQIDVRLGPDGTERVATEIVSANYFDVLGVRAAIGRTWHRQDVEPGTNAVAIISDALWRRMFAADPAIAGRQLIVNGQAFTITGVAPRAFRGLELTSAAELWVPLTTHQVAMPDFRAFDTELFGNRGTHWLNLVGRLRSDVTRHEAEVALRALADRQAELNPETNRDWSIAVVPVNAARLGPPSERKLIGIAGLMIAVVAFVLLIACANVANLLLAKGVSRRQEVAIRLAVGADRPRLVRQFLTEGMTLAMAGALAGVLVAAAAIRWISLGNLTADLPGLVVTLDWRVLSFALVVAAGTGLVFGVVPAWQARSAALTASLKARGDRTGWLGRRPFGQTLVAGQVALCLILLVGAGLMLRTVLNLQALPFGFDPHHLWVATLDLSGRGTTEQADARARETVRQLIARVRSMPGVESADVGLITPFSGNRMANDIFWIRSRDAATRERTNVDMNIVGSRYFETMRIPIVRGRPFAAEDVGTAIVNEALARRLWPDSDPIGQRLWSWNPKGPDRPLEVVGVARDGRYYRGWRNAGRPFLFVPFPDWTHARMAIHVRTRPGFVVRPDDVIREAAAVDATLPPPMVQSVSGAMAESIAVERTSATVLSLFGLLAVAIAGIGIYGVVSFVVSQRTYEMGVRIALGASRSAIAQLVLGQSTKPVLMGVVAGWCASLLLAGFIEALLFGVRPTDPVTFIAVSVTLVGIGLAAASVPAWRATRIEPIKALRAD
jgi:predicted permease